MVLQKPGSVLQQVWLDKDYIVSPAKRYQVPLANIIRPCAVNGDALCDRNILELDNKQTNKQTNKTKQTKKQTNTNNTALR